MTAPKSFRPKTAAIAAGAALALSLLVGPAIAQAQSGLDPTFGDNGMVALPDRSPAYLNDVAAFQEGANAGETVAVGGWGDNNESGPIVAVFGPHGIEAENSDQIPGALLPSGAGGQNFYAVAIDPDGKILVAGWSSLPTGGKGTIIARYGPDAQLDTSTDSDPGVAFGPGGQGYVLIPGALAVHDLKTISTGPAAGDMMLLGDRPSGGLYEAATLMRISSTGTVESTRDFTLAPNPANVDPSINNLPAGLAIDSDGRVVAAGYTIDAGQVRWGVVRFTADGDPDSSFGDAGGLAVEGSDSDSPSALTSIALDPAGRIVVAGNTQNGIALARLLEDGSPDPTFGDGGWAGLAAPTGAPGLAVSGIEATADGIYGGGGAERSDGKRVIAAMRLTNSGELDDSFGVGGVALGGPLADGTPTEASAIALDGQGILAVGQSGPGDRAIAARFVADGGVPGEGSGDGSAGVAADVATSPGIDVHKVRSPKSWRKLIKPGVRVLASCDQDCAMDVTVTVSQSTARDAGLGSITVARGSAQARAGERRWITARAIPSVRDALRSYSGHGHLHITVTAADPS